VIAQLRERVISNREQSRGQVLAGVDREIPRLIQAPARDSGTGERGEDPRVPAALRSLPGRQGAVVPELLEPGLNPSLRSNSATLIRAPAVFAGIAAAGRLTRNPVGELGSRLVNRSFGNGSRHGLAPNG
jgi:hypothetical protein